MSHYIINFYELNNLYFKPIATFGNLALLRPIITNGPKSQKSFPIWHLTLFLKGFLKADVKMDYPMTFAVLLYINVFYFGLYSVVEFLILMTKGYSITDSRYNLAAFLNEVFILAFMVVVESLRLFLGQKHAPVVAALCPLNLRTLPMTNSLWVDLAYPEFPLIMSRPLMWQEFSSRAHLAAKLQSKSKSAQKWVA